MSREVSFFIFRTTLSLIILAIQWYFYRRTLSFVRSRQESKKIELLLRSLFALFNLPLPVLIFIRPRLIDVPDWFITFGLYPFYVWHAMFFLLFVILFFFYLIRLPFFVAGLIANKIRPFKTKIERLKESPRFQRLDKSRRVFLQRSFTIIAGTTFAGTAYGAFTKYDYEVNRVNVFLRNLPQQFEDFRLTLIADIHSSVFMTKEDMVRYVKAINEIGSDLIVMPGDFVNSMVEEVYPFADAFSELRAPYGVYGSLGNHDFFTDVEAVAREVDACGVKLLRNDKISIEKNNARIQLLGVDDTGSARKAALLFDKVVSGTDSDIPRILLCHRPYFFEQAAERNLDLILSGHTHGGQIVFAKIGPTIIAPARVVSPYVAGLYTLQKSQMYVTRGLGTVGIPVRINCPAEITVITLKKAV